MSCSLDVWLGAAKVGALSCHQGQYVYASQAGVPLSLLPSLMVIQNARAGRRNALPAFLEVSMPEGHMRRAMVARLEGQAEPDDMALLRAIGGNMIGLLKATDPGTGLSKFEETLQLDTVRVLQMEERELLDLVFAQVGLWPGISGGFMKLLVSTAPELPHGRCRHWIVKLADVEHAGLCVIEHFGMYAARLMGLEVPETILSGDGSRLMVERFDFDTYGEPLGFEDMCSLGGAPAADKYAGSAERIVGLLASVCDPGELNRSLEAFFAQYLLASVIRNGDAHLKNFGVVYGSNRPTALSPVYDMLSMAVYAPKRNDGDAADGMALTLNGTRRWPSASMISDLARRCGVSRDRQVWWQECLQAALTLAGLRAAQAASQSGVRKEVIGVVARMIDLWSIGIRPYSSDSAQYLFTLAQSLRKDA